MPKSFHLLTTHIVFSTKGRTRLLSKPIRPEVCNYIATVLRNLECRSVTVGCVDDHVHIACNMTNKVAPTKIIERVKRDSSVWIKTKSASLRRFYWQTGYAIFSISPSHADALHNYVLRQEEHHKTESFQDEYLRLIRAYGLEYDERYMWD